MCILFSLFILFSGAAGTSGYGCQSSTPTFPKVPRLLSQCGTFMGPAEPFQSVEPLWLCLANMGKCVLALLLLAVVSRWCVKARWWEKSLGLPCSFLMTFPYYYNTQIGPHVLCNFTNVLPNFKSNTVRHDWSADFQLLFQETLKFMNVITWERGHVGFWNWYLRCIYQKSQMTLNVKVRGQVFWNSWMRYFKEEF